jgi:SAM-dependent methyltransferase
MADHVDLPTTVREWCNKPDAERDKIVNNAFHYITHHYTMKDSMEQMIKTIEDNWKCRLKEFTGERMMPVVTDNATEKQHTQRYNFFHSLAINKMVLDVGCGSGYGTNMLGAVAATAIGVDISQDTVEHARSSYPLGKFGKCDLLKLPHAKNSFDSVYCFEKEGMVSEKQLGGWKIEHHIEEFRALAPKCYAFKDSDNKNTTHTSTFGRSSSMNWKRGSRLIRYLSNKTRGTITRNQMKIIFNPVHHI